VRAGDRLRQGTVRSLFYHFDLPYSNWETGAICASESFATLAVWFQAAVWELGRVPAIHRTDNLSAATHALREGSQTATHYRQALDPAAHVLA
jgi:hypothetical protein